MRSALVGPAFTGPAWNSFVRPLPGSGVIVDPGSGAVNSITDGVAARQKISDVVTIRPGIFDEHTLLTGSSTGIGTMARASNVVTVDTIDVVTTDPAPHGLQVGDLVYIIGQDVLGAIEPSTLWDAATSADGLQRVATVPTTTRFTFVQFGANETILNGVFTQIGYCLPVQRFHLDLGAELANTSSAANKVLFGSAGSPYVFDVDLNAVLVTGFGRFLNAQGTLFTSSLGYTHISGLSADCPGLTGHGNAASPIAGSARDGFAYMAEYIRSAEIYGVAVSGKWEVVCPEISGGDNGIFLGHIGGDDLVIRTDIVEGGTLSTTTGGAGVVILNDNQVGSRLSIVHITAQHIQGRLGALQIRATDDVVDYGIDCMHFKATAGPALDVQGNAPNATVRTFPGARWESAWANAAGYALKYAGTNDVQFHDPQLITTATADFAAYAAAAQTMKLIGTAQITPAGKTIHSNITVNDASRTPYRASNRLAVYAAGTAYSITNTQAALDFGTTDPVLTLPQGTWRLRTRVRLDYNGATFAAVRNATVKLRRTNNTAADISNSSTTAKTAIITGISGTFIIIELPEVEYVASATGDDSITIFGGIDTAPTAGSLDFVEASIFAERVG